MPIQTADTVELHHRDAGSGDPAALLVHPFGGDHTFMGPQWEHLSRRMRAVAVDLRGHGMSPRPEGDYSIGSHVDDLVALCDRLGLGRVVVVGNSMGGMVALEMAARHPDRVAGAVLLDSPVVTPPGLLDGFLPYLEALRTPAYGEVTRQLYSNFVGFPDDAAARERILDHLASNDPRVLQAALEGVLAHDSAAAASRCRAPLLYVSSGPWYTDLDRFRSLCPQLVTGQTVGAGHFHQLEVPDQVNAMINRFLDLYLTASGPA